MEEDAPGRDLQRSPLGQLVWLRSWEKLNALKYTEGENEISLSSMRRVIDHDVSLNFHRASDLLRHVNFSGRIGANPEAAVTSQDPTVTFLALR